MHFLLEKARAAKRFLTPFCILPALGFKTKQPIDAARREGYMDGSQGAIVKLNTLGTVCGVGVEESCTVKVRL